MTQNVDGAVRSTLEALTTARAEFLEAVGMTSANRPEAASPEDIEELEEALGRRVPASYRAFLLIQNGFPELTAELSIFGTREMLASLQSDPDSLLEEISSATGEPWIARCLVFGRSAESSSAFLFDPERADTGGEWSVIEYDEEEGVEAIHDSFLEFLRVSAEEVREAAEESKQGADLMELDI